MAISLKYNTDGLLDRPKIDLELWCLENILHKFSMLDKPYCCQVWVWIVNKDTERLNLSKDHHLENLRLKFIKHR